MKVKKLEWTGATAKTPFGNYSVVGHRTFKDFEAETGYATIWFGYFNGCPLYGGNISAPTVNEAKKICQKHFKESVSECVELKELQAYKDALNPNKTKSIYIGEFSIPVTEMVYCDENPNEPVEMTVWHTVDWTTTKQIMAAITKTAQDFLDESK